MKIGLITSGGDAPGMNACVRAVVRSAAQNGLEVIGFIRGYEGILDKDYTVLKNENVAQIIQRGGTILKTARSKRFYEREQRSLAAENLRSLGVDSLIAIGGDGTFTGADLLQKEHGFKVVGVPGTIDNDLFGTDYTIGYDTAINTVVEAVDKIRDTALSHDRIFVVEVMGRDAGFIALRSGLAVGAEAILVPETKTDMGRVLKRLEGRRKSKQSAIVVVAEGDEFGGAEDVAKAIREKYTDREVKVTKLGHIQRGGNPSAMDRVLAGFLGVGAVEAVVKGVSGVMVGMQHKNIVHVPLKNAIKHHQDVDDNLLRITEMLSV
ncbi:6-phosphofructokinase [Parvicella tangerina]|uniref:ATP-dependent 6-phosphofructokinase n=1 Tax=Parvicella tangerina TaxID=2829795 RepID=A0A916JL69_9FLAO|nr:6-phosphofructokinase [Parvicella tangerina]CAG5079944.1 ATP-dependent 6-phosphofructokinase 1 [Parvicella tangerina]